MGTKNVTISHNGRAYKQGLWLCGGLCGTCFIRCVSRVCRAFEGGSL